MLLPGPAFFAVVFAALVIFSPLTVWSWLGVGMSVVCIVICANVLGMRIELDDDQLSKVYFWGLFRSSIPLKQLRTSTNRQTGRSPGSVDFASVDPNGPSFNVVPFFAWRVRDIDSLKAIAIDREQAIAPRYDLRPDSHLENFVIDSGRTYPVMLDSASGRAIGLCKAGGAKGAFWIEPDFDTRYPHKDISFFANWRADDAGVGHLTEVILVTPTGTSEDDERRSSYRSVQVESPADPDH